MKCVNCRKELSKKDREMGGGRCRFCYHPMVTEPSEDGLTDMAIKSAEEIVSANGTLYFLKDHLKYQLHRKLNKQIHHCIIALIVLLVIFLIMLVFAVIKGSFFVILTIVTGFAFVIALSIKAKHTKTISKLDAIIEKWATINPNEKLLTPEKFQAAQGDKPTNNLDDISFDRVLICERNETVDFLLSNLFHFHYSCPVLGGNGYPEAIYEDMLQRLKQNPDLKVFLLHDYSPAGYAFVRRIKTDPKWFGGKQKVNIIDLGLNINQKKLFKSMILKKPDRNKKIKETAEISLFQPATLVALCGAAINEGVAMDLVTAAVAANSSSGYG